MRKVTPLTLAAILSALLFALSGQAEDLSGLVKKAVEKSTLDQQGTKPFHLKAAYAPSFEPDKDSNRNGDIEIWWQSPTSWRREVRSPEFHQILIVDGARQWQKNEGDYFPEWLRELAVAIVRPVPLPMEVLERRVQTAETRRMRFPTKGYGQPDSIEQVSINWAPATTFGDAQANGKGYLALVNEELSYTGGNGFDGRFKDFKGFHGRMVARTISSGYPQVTANVSLLEDLGTTPPDFFDAAVPGGDTHPINTVVLDDAELRKSLISSPPFAWPPVDNGPFEGMAGTRVVLDRTGKIRDLAKPLSDNPAMVGAAEQGFRAMQFQPVLQDGVPVQAIGPLSVAFKTTRPAGAETLDSAKSYFERGRKLSCLGASAIAPYFLRADFQASGASGSIETGRYEDNWVSTTEWKREAWFGSSHLVRSQFGDQRYLLSEGPQAGLLRIAMLSLEPIPASDTMTESDWRIRRDTVDGLKTVRVFRGPEGPNGELEPGKSEGYWFDESGQLVRSLTSGLEIRPSGIEVYGGVQVARRIDLLKDGKLGMRLTVKEIDPAPSKSVQDFQLKGHEWQRAFTAEVR